MAPRGNLIITSKADPFPSTTVLQHFRQSDCKHQQKQAQNQKKKRKREKKSTQTNQIICPVVITTCF